MTNKDSIHFHTLDTLLSNLKSTDILCIGDIILDEFVFGKVTRISPEAPIPILQIASEQSTLGGAGNVARNLASLEIHCQLVALVGKDDVGNQMKELTQSIPQLTPHLISDPQFTSIRKTRYFSGNQQLLRVDKEIPQKLSSNTENALIILIQGLIPTVKAVILSDYGKGVLSEKVLSETLTAAQKAGKLIVVDPKGLDFTKYRNATVITPNQKELSEATGLPTESDAEVVLAANKIIETTGIPNILVTRGPKGMMLIMEQKNYVQIPTTAREIFDLSGAGDTVVATFTALTAMDVPLETAAEISNIAAGLVIEKVGTATVRREEIRHAIGAQIFDELESKMVSLEKAVEIRELWRRKNIRVGFTNGCFDLLHAGHVMLLHRARAQCDRLILAINSDSSVRKLKGKSRPIEDQDTRALVLASLKDVDLVLIFDEDTPIDLIQQLSPDLLFKGSDYTIDQVIGASIVQKYGGQVILIEVVPNQSTSETIKRLGQSND